MIQKQIKVKIQYTERLCGQYVWNKYMQYNQFKFCQMVDNDCDDYCHAYQVHLDTDVNRKPYRCKQCIKDNK